MKTLEKNFKVQSPMTGISVPINQVPDPVFSQKIIGDGMAVIPTENEVVSPVDGEVISIAKTGHAYGIRTSDGIKILIHVGLETVSMNGEPFQVKIKIGDKVKTGDLLSIVDLKMLEEKGADPISPVLICSDTDNKVLCGVPGPVTAAKDVLFTLREKLDINDLLRIC